MKVLCHFCFYSPQRNKIFKFVIHTKNNQEVELNGVLKGKELSHKLSFSLKSDINEVALIHRLAAKAKIKELEIDEGKLCFYNKNRL